MRAGQLDRRIDIQRSTRTRTDSGDVVENWYNLVTRRSAAYRPVVGEEVGATEQTVGAEEVEFRIRWDLNLSSLTQRDRIVYPAAPEDSPEINPEVRNIYDIKEVHEIGRRDGLQLITIRRSDAIP